jgi:hypothetical protein
LRESLVAEPVPYPHIIPIPGVSSLHCKVGTRKGDCESAVCRPIDIRLLEGTSASSRVVRHAEEALLSHLLRQNVFFIETCHADIAD